MLSRHFFIVPASGKFTIRSIARCEAGQTHTMTIGTGENFLVADVYSPAF